MLRKVGREEGEVEVECRWGGERRGVVLFPTFFIHLLYWSSGNLSLDFRSKCWGKIALFPTEICTVQYSKIFSNDLK